MPRKYPYFPAWNGEATDPVTKKFYDLCKRRWAFTNLGMYANRPMRGSKNLSVHATGFAVDMGYPATRAGRAAAREAWAVLSPMLMTLAGGLIGLLAGNGLKDKPKDPPTTPPVP